MEGWLDRSTEELALCEMPFPLLWCCSTRMCTTPKLCERITLWGINCTLVLKGSWTREKDGWERRKKERKPVSSPQSHHVISNVLAFLTQIRYATRSENIDPALIEDL